MLQPDANAVVRSGVIPQLRDADMEKEGDLLANVLLLLIIFFNLWMKLLWKRGFELQPSGIEPMSLHNLVLLV